MKKIILALSFVSLSFAAFATEKSENKVKKETKIAADCPADIVKVDHYVTCPDGHLAVDYTTSFRTEHCPGQPDRLTNVTINYKRPSKVCG